MKRVILYYPKLTGDKDSKPLYRGLPLSVLALAAQFDDNKYDICVIDGRLENDFQESLLTDDECICVGISAITSYQLLDGIYFVQRVKKLCPYVPIVWGGWHPSLMPYQTINSNFVDMIVTGQGEITFPQLVEALDQKSSLEKVPNLIYKANNKIIFTGESFLKDIKSVRPIENAYKYVDMEQYIQNLWGNKRVIGYESSRGCPWHCKFCSIGSIYNGRWNSLTAEQTFHGVEYLYKNYNIDAIHFYDNNFFVNEKRVLDFSRLLINENISLKWDGTAVVEQFSNFSDEYITELKRSVF